MRSAEGLVTRQNTAYGVRTDCKARMQNKTIFRRCRAIDEPLTGPVPVAFFVAFLFQSGKGVGRAVVCERIGWGSRHGSQYRWSKGVVLPVPQAMDVMVAPSFVRHILNLDKLTMLDSNEPRSLAI